MLLFFVNSVIEQLEKRKDPLDLEFDVSRLNRRERSHSTPAREFSSVALSPMTASRHTRTSSVSPVRSNKDTKYQLVMSERKVEDLKNTLRLRVNIIMMIPVIYLIYVINRYSGFFFQYLIQAVHKSFMS